MTASLGLAVPPPRRLHRPILRLPILTNIKAALTDLKAMKGQLKKSKKELLIIIKEDYPKDLKDIALLLYSMPVTQVSVETLFSALKIYKSDHRNRLKEDVLSSLLILRANA